MVIYTVTECCLDNLQCAMTTYSLDSINNLVGMTYFFSKQCFPETELFMLCKITMTVYTSDHWVMLYCTVRMISQMFS